MKSLWKQKLYTFNKLILINFKNLENIHINRKEFNLSDFSLRIVNRFVPIDLRYNFNNINLYIYNGKFFYIVKYKINYNKYLFKFGELSFTRRMGLIHKAKKKNKKSNKK